MWLPGWDLLLTTGAAIGLAGRGPGDTPDQVITVRGGMGLLAAGGPLVVTGPGTARPAPGFRLVAVTAH